MESFATFHTGDDADEDDEGFSGKEKGQGHVWCSDWNARMEMYGYYKGKFGKTEKKLNSKSKTDIFSVSIELVLVHVASL